MFHKKKHEYFRDLRVDEFDGQLLVEHLVQHLEVLRHLARSLPALDQGLNFFLDSLKTQLGVELALHACDQQVKRAFARHVVSVVLGQ